MKKPEYDEILTSRRTGALFVLLAALFLGLLSARYLTRGMDALAWVCLVLFLIFLFYIVNYRVLVIRVTSEALALRFGIIRWRVELSNVESCGLDHLPPLLKYGGAGVHFMTVRGRYRVSFNFLEYPRVVLALKKKMGPVRDVSFSTRYPDKILQLVQSARGGYASH